MNEHDKKTLIFQNIEFSWGKVYTTISCKKTE